MSDEIALSVDEITKIYAGAEDGVRAVDGVSFTIEEGKFYTLLGPSGCGKTTTLRCVAGLERTDAGKISLAGTVVSSHQPRLFVRPDERDIGMVFQSYAIWPHMTVYDNVAFPLRAAGRRRTIPRSGIRKRVMDVLETVQLHEYAERSATKLSGGQQQRLALARALARAPKILLLDEPLSNLDAGLRELMRTELRRLHRTVGVTTLYVTHDQSEALSMSNRVAVMEGGRIVQEGSPRDIYRRPRTTFVATFVGRTNLLDARVSDNQAPDGTFGLETPAGVLRARCPADTEQHEGVSLSVRPEDVHLHSERRAHNSDNVLSGRVESVVFLGEIFEYQVSVGREMLLSRQHPDLVLHQGQEIFVELPVQRCIIVSDKNGASQPAPASDGSWADQHPIDAEEAISSPLGPR